MRSIDQQLLVKIHFSLYDGSTENCVLAVDSLVAGDVLLSGHSHVAGIEQDAKGICRINPGSITFPRNGAEPSYAIYQHGTLNIIGLQTERVLDSVQLSVLL